MLVCNTVCRGCAPDGEGEPVTPGVINAMRHICTCDDRALFAFRMPDSSLKILGDITEQYLLLQLGHKLRTLDFYRSIKMRALRISRFGCPLF